jgi:hypothetical protein
MTRLASVSRWAATPVMAALSALVAQLVVYRASLELLSAAGLVRSGTEIWATKAFTSVFMGAAAVTAVWWVAPAAKMRAASLALLVVAIWAGVLIIGGTVHGPSGWLVGMGVAGIAGGVSAWWVVRRRSAEHE